MASFDPQKAIQHLRAKWQNPCPMCGVGDWDVNPATFELREFNNGDMVIGGPIVPVIVAICRNCGNTVLVNAIKAGIVEAPKEAKP